MVELFDVAIVGAGPAGASCAAFCAAAGWRTLLLERETFPREKVCGDCLNPSVWPVLARLQLVDRVRALSHGKLRQVNFIAIDGKTVSVDLPDDVEIAVRRSLFDQLLVARAVEAGAEICEATTVANVTRSTAWEIQTSTRSFRSRVLVAADGRNSTVARLLGLLPRIKKERVGLQAHVPLPSGFGDRVVLQFRPEGYSGQAPIGDATLNLCLVSHPRQIESLRKWAVSRFNLRDDQTWRTITPLRRDALPPAHDYLFLVGDAARVVEPFTGEGISYALSSGELAGKTITHLLQSGDVRQAIVDYTSAHRRLYRGRLWVNQLARAAVLSPRFTSTFLSRGLIPRALLRALTSKVVQ